MTQLSSGQLAVVQTLYNDGQYAAAYAYIHGALEGASGLDQGVRDWFGIAAEVNGHSGSLLDGFVRTYTQNAAAIKQIEITDQDFQDASDELARNIIGDILGNEGVIPTSNQIIDHEVQDIVDALNLENEDWAGTLMSGYFFGFDAMAEYLYDGTEAENFSDLTKTLFNNMMSGLAPFLNPDNPPSVPEILENIFNPPNFPPKSPIVLDTNFSHTIDLTTLGDTGTYFDLNGDGQAELTAWITDGDGLLARDLNANGNIDDITELFGSESEDGFTALRDLDSNADGKITGADDDWGDLVVWIDENMDALTQDGELHTLDDLGIVSISLDATLQEDMTVNGSQITHTSSFITDTDEAFGIVDAWFDHDTGMTRNVEDFDFDIRAAYLPTLRGFGEIKDLHIAASIDNGETDSTMSMLTDIASTITGYTGPAEVFENWSDIETDVDALLLKWAGVEGVDPDSRGDHVDAQHLAFYEAFTGQAFEQYGQPNPLIEAGAQIEAMYAYIKTYLTTQIVAQVISGDIFEVAPAYSMLTAAMDGDMALSQDAMDDFAAAAEVAADPVEVWTHFAQFLGYTKGFDNLTVGEIAMLDGAVDDTNEASLTDWDDVVNTMIANLGDIIDSPDDWGSFEVYYDAIINGTSGADTLTAASNVSHKIIGQAGNDTITGLAGHDRLEGGSGNDTLDGGAGDDYLLGSSGDDIYIWSSGNDTFSDSSSSTDEIQVASSTGFDSTDIVDIYRSGADLIIQMPGGEFLTIDSQFVSSSNRIETLRFMDDNSTISLTSLPYLNTYGSAASETLTVSSLATGNVLYGNGGNDKLVGGSGADELHGGSGADYLKGGSGNDILDGGSGDDILTGESFGDTDGDETYIASSGHDVIYDRGGDDDQIVFGDSLLAEDLTLTRIFDPNEGANPNTSDLKIEWGASSIRIHAQFDDVGAIETLVFDDTSTLNLAETQITTYGSDDAFLVNADYDTFLEEISGIATDGYNHDDIIYARGGDDTVHGLDGEDLIYGGDGNDTLEGGEGSDTLDGGAGDDILYGDGIEEFVEDSDTYIASIGNDLIFGGYDGDILIMPETVALSDVSISRSGYDLVVSWDGNTTTIIDQSVDEIQFPADGFTLDATQFADFWFFGTSGADTLNGTSSADIIYGFAGNDTINGSSGADILIGGAGNDTLNGGADEDTADYSTAAAGVTVNLSTGSASNDGDGGSDTLSGIEDVIGSGYADTITGDANANYIAGLAGADTISGGDGDDWLTGGTGNDTLNGGNGEDEIDYQSAASGVTVNLGTGTASDGDGGTDTLSNIEDVMGSIYADTITGDANNNFLAGITGNDSLSGGDGSDLLIGGSGNDTLDGGADEDTVAYYDATSGATVNLGTGTASDGQSGTDTISNVEGVLGSNYNDTITGSSGANVIEGGAGNDTLDGGSGTDTVSYTGAASAVTVSLANGSAQSTGGAGTDTISNFENLTGSAYNDSLTGNSSANVITGGVGNDTLSGAAGDDTYVYNAGDGDDVITDSAGADIIKLGPGLTGDDVDFTKDGDDLIITVGAGSITVTDHFASGDAYAVETLLFDDTSTIDLTALTLIIEGTSGADTLTGTSNADIINGLAGNDTINGGGGNDTIEGGAGDDTMDAGSGTDTLTYANAASAVTVSLANGSAQNTGEAGTDTITGFEDLIGSVYNDTLIGDSAANVINGGDGNDTLKGGAGIDTLDGDAGTDTADYSSAAGAVTVNLSSGTSSNDGDGGSDTLSDIENVIGSANADTITGDTGANVIEGGAGNDTLDGGSGTDTVSYANAASAVTVSLANGSAQNTVGAGTDTLSNFENLTGSSYNDTLTGNSGANVVTGGDGNDTINGGAGNDTIDGGNGTDTASFAGAAAMTVNLATGTATGDGTDTLSNIENITGSSNNDTITGNSGTNSLGGGSGNDTLIGGAGNDTLTGGSGTDTVDYSGTASGVTVDLFSASASNDGDGGSDTLNSIENVIGSAYADTITGDNNGNVLDGGAGDDTIQGRAGNDTLIGGSGTDTITFANASGIVTIDLTVTTSQNTGAGTDTISGFENVIGSSSGDTITGDSGANVFYGGSSGDTLIGAGGGDTLYGESGNDTLIGGAGNDTLDGGANTDTVDFSAAAAGIIINLATGIVSDDGDGGYDTVTGIENVIGSAYNDSITGDSNNNVLTAGDGNDIVEGGALTDTLTGGSGTDLLTYVNATSAITISLAISTGQNTGGAGTDSVSGFESLTGSAYNDTLTGDSGANVINGGAGNDTVKGAGGNDTLDGESGTDTLSYSAAAAGVTASLASGTASNDGDGGADTLSNFENLTGSSYADTLTGDSIANVITGGAGNDTIVGGDGNDTLNGDNDDDTLIGGSGDDSLNGGAGNDILSGGAGNDTLTAGGGTDTVDYSAAAAAVTVNLSTESTSDDGDGGSDTLSGILSVIGSAYADTITCRSSSAAQVLDAGSGNDTIYMLTNTFGTGDSILGGGGTDAIIINSGSSFSIDFTIGTLSSVETLTGGSGNNTVTILASHLGGMFTAIDLAGAGADVLNVVASGDISAATAATISNTETGNLTGTSGTDTITLTGSQLDAIIIGSGTINLGTGSGDTINLTSTSSDLNTLGTTDASIQGVEAISASTAGSGVTITLSGQTEAFTLTGSSSADTITAGSGADTVTGGSGNDTLTGGSGNDILYGSGGNDTLYGGANDDLIYGQDGDDSLTGDGGADTFVFEAATAFNNVDDIQDFSTGQSDKLDISDILDGFYTYGTDDITQFVQITDNGTDSTLAIDQNGGGDNFVSVAMILGITGLTNEASLETSGALITH